MVHLMKLFYYPIESNWWLLNNTGCNITPHLYNVYIYTHMHTPKYHLLRPPTHFLYQLTLNYSVYLIPTHWNIIHHTHTNITLFPTLHFILTHTQTPYPKYYYIHYAKVLKWFYTSSHSPTPTHIHIPTHTHPYKYTALTILIQGVGIKTTS